MWVLFDGIGFGFFFLGFEERVKEREKQKRKRNDVLLKRLIYTIICVSKLSFTHIKEEQEMKRNKTKQNKTINPKQSEWLKWCLFVCWTSPKQRESLTDIKHEIILKLSIVPTSTHPMNEKRFDWNKLETITTLQSKSMMSVKWTNEPKMIVPTDVVIITSKSIDSVKDSHSNNYNGNIIEETIRPVFSRKRIRVFKAPVSPLSATSLPASLASS